MRWLIGLAAVAILSSARAGDIPQSVWKTEADGTARHLQTGWDCPKAYDKFTRGSVEVFDPFGLGVACNYASGKDKISLYMSMHPDGDLKADLEAGKAAIVKNVPDAALLPDAEQASFASDTMVAHALYGLKDGNRTGAWFVRAGEWMFEIRATYAAERQAAMFATLAKIAARLAGGAARHLARCAKSPIPTRDGKPVAESGVPLNAMTLAYLMSAAVADSPDAKPEDKPDPKTVPTEWCVEGGLQMGGAPTLIWHGLNSDGAPVTADRATLMTMGDPVAIEVELNAELNKIEEELKSASLPVYAVTAHDGDTMHVIRFYSRRPPEADLARILDDILNNRVKYLGGIDVKTKSLQLPGQ